MTLSITLPDEIAKRLDAHAKAAGMTVEHVVLAAIEHELTTPRTQLDELLVPVRNAYGASGLSEEESMDLLEVEKHAMRRERGLQNR